MDRTRLQQIVNERMAGVADSALFSDEEARRVYTALRADLILAGASELDIKWWLSECVAAAGRRTGVDKGQADASLRILAEVFGYQLVRRRDRLKIH